ncbi:MAG: uncharacterized protein JWN93_1794 [Hyphomicrobiales bacterium]|nr:uncharacterized protein [Hyphomicrobiales bacterium]
MTARLKAEYASAAARFLKLAALSAGAAVALGGAAFAQSCNEDIGKFQAKRNVHIEQLNKLAKAAKGKLDPIASCPRLRSLVSVEREMLAYMEKNQAWCSIPDNVIEQVKGGGQKTGQIADQACKFAAQAKKMQQQQSQMQAAGAPPPPSLPRGPL